MIFFLISHIFWFFCPKLSLTDWSFLSFLQITPWYLILCTKHRLQSSTKFRFWSFFGQCLSFFWLFLEIFLLKNRFQTQEVQKKSMLKNGVNTALWPLFKKLWAILGFSKNQSLMYVCKIGKKLISQFFFWVKSDFVVKFFVDEKNWI